MNIEQLQDEAIKAATEHIRNQRISAASQKMKSILIAIVACVLFVCLTVVACFAIYSQNMVIIEQQYALNAQYAGLLDMMNGAEITTEIVDGSGDGVATKIDGSGNSISVGE